MDRLRRAQGGELDIAVGVLDLEVDERGAATGCEDLSRVDVSGWGRESQDWCDARFAERSPGSSRAPSGVG